MESQQHTTISGQIWLGWRKLLLALLCAVFSSSAAAGTTYFTNTDNQNNAGTNVADNDMGIMVANVDAVHPIEFDIDVTGALPTSSATLVINAFDVDEESGEIHQVFFNGNLLGRLSGQDSLSSNTVFELPIGQVIAGDNLVQVSVSGVSSARVDSGQLLIDQGDEIHTQITALDIASYSEAAGTVTLDIDFDFDINTTGNFHIELNLIDADGNNVSLTTEDFAGSSGTTLSRTYSPTYITTESGGTYSLELMLFYDDGGFLVQQDYQKLDFLHVQNVGPNLPAAPGNSTISSGLSSIVANGSSSTVITLQGIDVGDNITAVSGQTVTFATTLGSLTSVTDQGDGTYTAVLTSSTTAGTATVSGTLDGNAVTDTAVVSYIPGPASAATTTITTDSASLVANGLTNTTITIQAFDVNGNALTTGGDLLVLNTNIGTISGLSDLGNGSYQALLTSPTVVSVATVTATLNGNAVTDNAVVNFVVGTASELTTTITSSLSTLVADGLTETTLTVQTYDANGNILITGGDTLVLNTTSGTLSAVTDNNDGSYSATLRSGTSVVTALISGTLNSAPLSDTENVSYVAVPTANTLISNDPTPTLTGTATVFAGATLRVQVNGAVYTDGDGNLASSGSNWSLTIPGSNALSEGAYSITASVTDAASQVSIDPTSSELTLDLTIPTLTFNTLPAPDSFSVPAYTISGSCSEIGALIDLSVTDTSTASIVANNLPCSDDGAGSGVFSTTLDLSNLLDGLLNLDGDITDVASNQSTTSTSVSKDGCSPDNTVAICDDDRDGISNGLELAAGTNTGSADTDGDGITDDLELGADPSTPDDTDADGIIDALDTDSDNDLIPDSIEAGSTPSMPRDFDGDGIPDFRDRDSDDDYIPDALEYQVDNVDPDSDGFANYIDLDSDGDGLPDTIENGVTLQLDSDADQIDDAFDFDLSTDTDGLDSRLDGITDGLSLRDTDLDGDADPYDRDADNDGVSDTLESDLDLTMDGDADGIIDSFDADATGRPDANSDGIDDLVSLLDTDNDGVPNYRDLDSDNDTVNDVLEAAANDSSPEDAIIDNPETAQASVTTLVDTDSDGIPDIWDVESTNPLNNLIGPFDIATNSDAATLDADNDGVIDIFVDTDGDGIGDSVDESVFRFGSALDPDLDGIENKLDLDDDNDGIPDTFESSGQVDTDGDTWADAHDLDSDNDGLTDLEESGSGATDSDNNGVIDSVTDANSDGLEDSIDETTPPRRSDSDSRPDFRDLDSDGDGLFDLTEATAPDTITPNVDLDNNGRVDSISNNLGRPTTLFAPVDSDGDGSPDYADPDSDNDGYDDGQEDGDFNNDGINDRIQIASDKIETSIQGAGSFDWLMLLALMPLLLLRRLPSALLKVKPLVAGAALLLSGLLLPEPVLADNRLCGLFSAIETGQDKHDANEQDQDEQSENELEPRASGPTYFNRCGYWSGGLALSKLEPEGTNSGWSTDDTNSLAASIALGWHLTPKAFIELGYVYLGEAGLGNSSPVLDREVDATIEYSAPFLMLGYWFKQEARPLNAFIKLGASKLSASQSDDRLSLEESSSTQFAFGAGVRYRYRNSPWFTHLEYTSYAKDAATFGLSFGRYFGYSPNTALGNSLSAHATHKRVDQFYAPAQFIDEANNDDDGDSIINKYDLCPHTLPGIKVNENGCCSDANGCQILFQEQDSPLAD